MARLNRNCWTTWVEHRLEVGAATPICAVGKYCADMTVADAFVHRDTVPAPRFWEASSNAGLIAAVQTGPPLSEASDVVVFVHGITANALSWPLVVGRLPSDVATISVDLRGRGASAGLPGPYGMATHADDIARLLDHLGVSDPVLMVGHSMGGFVTSTFARRYPARLRGAVLVDGGVALIELDGQDPDVLLAAVLGPAAERLTATYRTRGDYRLFWQSHPGFAGVVWTDFLERYINHDLGGVEPELATRVVAEAMWQDGREIFTDSEVTDAVTQIMCPVELLRAERGLMNEPQPLIRAEVADEVAEQNPNLSVTFVPATNHYTILMVPAGADAVAAAIRRQM